MHQITTLDNGLRIVTQNMPGLETVSMGIWNFVGGRDEEEKVNGIKSCNEAPSDIKESVLLSKLEGKQSKILRIAKKFEVNRLSETELIILCNSKIEGTTTQINNKKAKYFNDQMIAFSEMLMLKLYREAIIK